MTEAQEGEISDTDHGDSYERINKLWEDADMPALGRETPDREDGWQVLLAWVDRLQGRTAERPFRPSYDAIWRHQVHVFSHYLNLALGGVSGHSLRHAAIDEEGTRLVLDWWNGVKDARGGPQSIAGTRGSAA